MSFAMPVTVERALPAAFASWLRAADDGSRAAGGWCHIVHGRCQPQGETSNLNTASARIVELSVGARIEHRSCEWNFSNNFLHLNKP